MYVNLKTAFLLSENRIVLIVLVQKSKSPIIFLVKYNLIKSKEVLDKVRKHREDLLKLSNMST